jgi:hypothetical protein
MRCACVKVGREGRREEGRGERGGRVGMERVACTISVL